MVALPWLPAEAGDADAFQAGEERGDVVLALVADDLGGGDRHAGDEEGVVVDAEAAPPKARRLVGAGALR